MKSLLILQREQFFQGKVIAQKPKRQYGEVSKNFSGPQHFGEGARWVGDVIVRVQSSARPKLLLHLLPGHRRGKCRTIKTPVSIM